MIELTEQQSKSLENAGGVLHVVDPNTQDQYVIVKREHYEKMQAVTDGFSRSAGWDDPELDVYESFRKKS